MLAHRQQPCALPPWLASGVPAVAAVASVYLCNHHKGHYTEIAPPAFWLLWLTARSPALCRLGWRLGCRGQQQGHQCTCATITWGPTQRKRPRCLVAVAHCQKPCALPPWLASGVPAVAAAVHMCTHHKGPTQRKRPLLSGCCGSPPEALRSAALAGVWGAGGGSRGMKVGAAHRCPTSVGTVSFSEPASLSSMTASRPMMCPELAWKHPAVSTGELSPLQRHRVGAETE